MRLLHVDPGYEFSHVATAQIRAARRAPPAPRRIAFYEELLARSATLPSVQVAGLAKSLTGFGRTNVGFRFQDGLPSSRPPAPMSADLRIVSPGSFTVLGPRLRAGRLARQRNQSDTPRAALVQERVPS